jgi:hypothetical protein
LDKQPINKPFTPPDPSGSVKGAASDHLGEKQQKRKGDFVI